MCGRFHLVKTPGITELFDKLGVPVTFEDRYNIAPTEQIPVVVDSDGERQVFDARWWLVPSWSSGPDQKYAMFNARAETLSTSRAYRGPFRHRRCLIPASAFIEWTTSAEGKLPYEITTAKQALAIAGLWDHWQGGSGESIYSCTMVTTEAVPAFKHIHQRMPLILDDSGQARWLDIACQEQALAPILGSHSAEPFEIYPISKAVNNSRNKSPTQRLG